MEGEMIAIDMPMPKECNKCFASNYNMGTIYCKATKKDLKPIPFEGKPVWCPLIDLTQYEDDLK